MNTLTALEANGNRCRVYIDESFVNRNHSLTKGWYIKTEGKEIFKPTGLGARVAMIAAITETQWLGTRTQNIKQCLSIERFDSTHEYRAIKYWKVDNDIEGLGNMNYKLFKIYFQNCVLPNLPPNSIVIIDNAKYHRCYPAGTLIPTSACNKSQLIEFLKSRNQEASMDEKKKKLLKRAKVFKDDIKTEIQMITEAAGHQLLYLPPYHPEVNPIELAWSYVKRNVAEAASYNIDTICNDILPTAFSTLNTNTIQKFFSHVKNNEEYYRVTTPKEKQLIISQMNQDNNDSSDSELTDDSSYDSDFSSEASVISDLDEVD